MRLLRLLLLTVLVGACSIEVGGGEDAVTSTWDLRDTRTIDAVGWPEASRDLSAFEATTDEGLERILLPDDVEVTGEFRANVSRDGGLAGRELEDEVRALVVTFDEEPVADVLARARTIAVSTGVDLAPITEWARTNAHGQATGSGAAQASTRTVPLGEGASLSLSTRALPGGDGLLRLEVTWER